MIPEKENKRLFFAAQVEAPWNPSYPPARLVPEETRHLTLAFLGEQSLEKLKLLLPSVPIPPFRIGPTGVARELIFLPPEKSRVAALLVNWRDPVEALPSYQKFLCEWLSSHQYPVDPRPFLPHVTVARTPFDETAWRDSFTPLPLFVKTIRLYESLGSLQYESIWECPLLPPFEEFEHTADIAFLVRGMTPQELHRNAELALAFKFPPFVDFFCTKAENSLDEIIIALNQSVARADAEIGCPFKAISFHGNIKMDVENGLSWEMIVDV